MISVGSHACGWRRHTGGEEALLTDTTQGSIAHVNPSLIGQFTSDVITSSRLGGSGNPVSLGLTGPPSPRWLSRRLKK